MYIPNPKHEFKIFVNSHKEGLDRATLQEAIKHANAVDGFFDELDVYSISPNRLWYAGPEGIEKWLATKFNAICSRCPWEAFIDFEYAPDNEQVLNWYYDGYNVYCNVGVEYNEEEEEWTLQELYLYEDWFKIVNDQLTKLDEPIKPPIKYYLPIKVLKAFSQFKLYAEVLEAFTMFNAKQVITDQIVVYPRIEDITQQQWLKLAHIRNNWLESMMGTAEEDLSDLEVDKFITILKLFNLTYNYHGLHEA